MNFRDFTFDVPSFILNMFEFKELKLHKFLIEEFLSIRGQFF